MNRIPKGAIVSTVSLLVLLIGLNLWLWPDTRLQQSATSFGIMRNGYKAVFDLLSELKFPVTRSYRRPSLLDENQTMWFVAPSFLQDERPTAGSISGEVVNWAARGGTAVLFGSDDSDWAMFGIHREVEKEKGDADESRILMQGNLAPRPRWLAIAELNHFAAAENQDQQQSHERVAVTANGKAFAIEIPVGKKGGRIIAVADNSFLRNENLAEADASLLVVDLVRAYGVPTFDEYAHGLAPPSSLTLAILSSRAMLSLTLGLLTAVLWMWSQRAWPRIIVIDEPELPAPSIVSFVESLAILYSRAEDPGTVFGAYRAGFLRRLRKQLGLRADYPEGLLLERIGRDRSLPEETRHWLLARDAPADQRHLVAAIRAVESYPRPGA